VLTVIAAALALAGGEAAKTAIGERIEGAYCSGGTTISLG
jgi:hypothetical protein